MNVLYDKNLSIFLREHRLRACAAKNDENKIKLQ